MRSPADALACAQRAQATYRFPGHATADGTWAYGEIFKNQGDRHLAPDHYNSVYYMQGARGARAACLEQNASRSALRRALHRQACNVAQSLTWPRAPEPRRHGSSI